MAPAGAGAEAAAEANWTSGGPPRPIPRPLAAEPLEVSRESGLQATKGTFGTSERFGDRVVGPGCCSPKASLFYGNNNKFPRYKGLSCSQGFGERHRVELQSPPSVGPGSYDLVGSCYMKRSPLDGREHCTTTMHAQLPSKLVPVDMCSPGPHHKYEVRRPLDHHLPTYGVERLSRGARHPFPEDRDDPELLNPRYNTIAASASCPAGFRGGQRGKEPIPEEATAGGTKRCLKTTFGTAERFRAARSYSGHADHLAVAAEDGRKSAGLLPDYLSRSRSCSFGCGQKTDFSNPYHGHRSSVSPVTYSPGTGQVGKSTALDGLATRCASPVRTFARSMRGRRGSGGRGGEEAA